MSLQPQSSFNGSSAQPHNHNQVVQGEAQIRVPTKSADQPEEATTPAAPVAISPRQHINPAWVAAWVEDAMTATPGPSSRARDDEWVGDDEWSSPAFRLGLPADEEWSSPTSQHASSSTAPNPPNLPNLPNMPNDPNYSSPPNPPNPPMLPLVALPPEMSLITPAATPPPATPPPATPPPATPPPATPPPAMPEEALSSSAVTLAAAGPFGNPPPSSSEGAPATPPSSGTVPPAVQHITTTAAPSGQALGGTPMTTVVGGSGGLGTTPTQMPPFGIIINIILTNPAPAAPPEQQAQASNLGAGSVAAAGNPAMQSPNLSPPLVLNQDCFIQYPQADDGPGPVHQHYPTITINLGPGVAQQYQAAAAATPDPMPTDSYYSGYGDVISNHEGIPLIGQQFDEDDTATLVSPATASGSTSSDNATTTGTGVSTIEKMQGGFLSAVNHRLEESRHSSPTVAGPSAPPAPPQPVSDVEVTTTTARIRHLVNGAIVEAPAVETRVDLLPAGPAADDPPGHGSYLLLSHMDEVITVSTVSVSQSTAGSATPDDQSVIDAEEAAAEAAANDNNNNSQDNGFGPQGHMLTPPSTPIDMDAEMQEIWYSGLLRPADDEDEFTL